jgi:tetratricopeptide (TPR) repeat protein
MKQRSLYILVFALCCCGAAYAQEGDFYKANEFYQNGEYDKAIAEYEKIYDKGYQSGNLYYNLGNAYFKTGKMGKAILSYERARRLIPRDADLESNYKHARSLIEGSALAPSKPWIARFIHNIFGQFAVNEIAILLSILYMLVLALLATAMFIHSKRQVAIAIGVVIVIFTLGASSLSQKAGLTGSEAIVMEKSGEAKFEPFERATTHFTIYEGMKVRAVHKNSGWHKIERLDGKIGWVRSSGIEII